IRSLDHILCTYHRYSCSMSSLISDWLGSFGVICWYCFYIFNDLSLLIQLVLLVFGSFYNFLAIRFPSRQSR
ncbi:MAG: hypothetical protein M0Q51_17185, partial [Bacteroidales bacterium]|nr:hypothetical protein [Bacteroidales bacterium]